MEYLKLYHDTTHSYYRDYTPDPQVRTQNYHFRQAHAGSHVTIPAPPLSLERHVRSLSARSANSGGRDWAGRFTQGQ
jgi:hypothetical protein